MLVYQRKASQNGLVLILLMIYQIVTEKLIIVGLLTGFLSSCLAAGGGPFLFLLMLWWCHYDMRQIKGLSLSTLMIVASLGWGGRFLYESSDMYWQLSAWGVVPGIMGAAVGKLLEKRLNKKWAGIFFSVILICAGLRMMCLDTLLPVPFLQGSSFNWLIAGTGIAAGIASSTLGMGGGLFFVPVLRLAGELSPHAALITSLAMSVPMMITGAFLYHQEGHVDVRILWSRLIPSAVIGTAFGLWVSLYHMPDKIFSIIFGIVLIGCSIFVIDTVKSCLVSLAKRSTHQGVSPKFFRNSVT